MVKSGFGFVWSVAGFAFFIVMVAGFFLGHSDSFKSECGQHKVNGTSMGFFKNTVCDLDFTLDY